MSGSAVRVFAPGTVGNVACGFDVLGLALEAPGDRVTARRSTGPGVRIAAVRGDGGRLPTDPGRNAAGRAAAAVLRELGRDGEPGVALELDKGLPLAGGMGGSAASSVAAAVAVDALLGGGLPAERLLACALEGERLAAGAPHADNAAPALLGGIVLVLPDEPLRVVPLPVPAGLAVALVHPPLELDTGEGRRLLGDRVPLPAAVAQWGRTAGLVAALYREDLELLARCLVDAVAEPVRAPAVPGFAAAKRAALEAGALGASLSGSGPSVFALCAGVDTARRAGEAMAAAFAEAGVGAADVHAGPVGRRGARLETPGEGES